MRTRYKILIGIFTFLLICASLLFWRYQWVQSKYAEDYVALENEIFLPDTEGRGFSDKVKKDIENNFKSEEVRLAIGKYAKSKRTQLRSKTYEDYIKNTRESLLRFMCVRYLSSRKKLKDLEGSRGLIPKKIIYDNEEMERFEDYLRLFKFGSSLEAQKEGEKAVNEINVRTPEDYESQCI